MSLNCESVAAKFDELNFFIDEMVTHNCYVDVINLQETWLGDSSYYIDFTIPGYDLSRAYLRGGVQGVQTPRNFQIFF